MITAHIYNFDRLCLIRFDCFPFVLKLLGFNYHTITCRQLPQALNDQGRFKMAAEVGNACPFPVFDIGEPKHILHWVTFCAFIYSRKA